MSQVSGFNGSLVLERVSIIGKTDNLNVKRLKGGQPPHRGLIAEKCISPPSEEIFSSNFQH